MFTIIFAILVLYALGFLILANLPKDGEAGCAAAMIGIFLIIIATNFLILLFRALSGDVI